MHGFFFWLTLFGCVLRSEGLMDEQKTRKAKPDATPRKRAIDARDLRARPKEWWAGVPVAIEVVPRLRDN